ncbi:hypothetical protein ACG2LH_02800 [Zhouia sp. PK063]|uniref:hypothetical protein n=1 Tax=Zhouia sp. PK063 TaxID=3373602 RepID=UPI00378B39F3
MHLEDFLRKLKALQTKRYEFQYELGNVPALEDFITVEKNLGIQIPLKIKQFYSVANGLKTKNPHFEIVALQQWQRSTAYIHFATFDHDVDVYFATHTINEAGEWDILTMEKHYCITYTISSFWSNKLWYWLERGKPIWLPNWYEDI